MASSWSINGRKSLSATISQTDPASDQVWLDMDRIASVEVTSEQPGYPIESALRGESRGWRAANPGTQIVRMIFDQPQTLRRIWLVFEDNENARNQEFVLRCSLGQECYFCEILRQPWVFSHVASIREI